MEREHLEIVTFQIRSKLFHDRFRNDFAAFDDNLARFRISQRFGQTSAQKTRLKIKFLIDLVTTDCSKVIAFRIKEARRQQAA